MKLVNKLLQMALISLIKRQAMPLKIAAGVALIVFAINSALTELAAQRKQEMVEQEVRYRLANVRARLEQGLNASIFLTQGLDAHIASHHELDLREFNVLAKAIMDSEPEIRNIGLAPNNVIEYIYPLEGNEAALGLDYMRRDSQRDAVLSAIASNQIMVAGPIKLIQGGEGVIAQKPVFYEANERRRYWGIVSIVIDTESLYRRARLSQAEQHLQLSIRGVDGKGPDGKTFYGDPSLFEQNPQTLLVTLPNGNWQLAGVPVAGWAAATQLHWMFIAVNLLITLSMASISFVAAHHYQAAKAMARQDPLTGLPNRLRFDEKLAESLDYCRRYSVRGALMVIDLDKFKPINDRHGHTVGDVVLQTVAERLVKELRRSDTVCRIGGDEFIVMLPHITNEDGLEVVCQKLVEALTQPIEVKKNLVVQIGASIGACYFPHTHMPERDILAQADAAMYRAKQSGGSAYYISAPPKANLKAV